MNLKTFTDNFDLLADTPNGIPKLRDMILQLAVRGKLVPQNPDDEPASVLLEKIAAEKKRLIAEGKIKKMKPLPPIVPDEMPYDLPASWLWVRLGDVTNYGLADKVEPGDVADGTWTLELGDIEKTTSKLLVRVRYPEREFKSTKNVFVRGNVLYGKLRPYLDKVLVADEPGVCTTEIIPIHGYGGLNPFYLRIALKTPHFIDYANSSTHGMNLPRLGKDKAHLAALTLPPLAEQKRIVAKVDELMALCDQLEERQKMQDEIRVGMNAACLHDLTSAEPKKSQKGWTRIRKHFDLLYDTLENVTALRQSILQLAVMGRLVPQDAKDEPASVLLEKIAAEKKRLIAEGKIKKMKPLPPIVPDEMPYDLPEGWEWVRLGIIGRTQTGTTPPKTRAEYFGSGYPFVKPADITEKGIMFCGEELTEAGIAKGRRIPAGSAMMVCIGGSIGKVGHVDRECSCNQQINVLTPHSGIDGRFVAYWMMSPIFQLQVLSEAPQTTLPILSKGKWEQLQFPLPPLAEQKRILAKVDELMSLCDKLKSKLQQSRSEGEQLMAAVVNQIAMAQDVGAVHPLPVNNSKKKRGQTESRATNYTPRVSIDDLETDEVMAAFRKVCRGRAAMNREELLKEVSTLIGNQRLGPAIQERLKGHLRAAIRRKIIGTNGTEVWLETPTMDDYDRTDLVGFLGSVMRWDKEYDREEVIRALANYLGFRRLTEGVQAPIKSAINSAIRQGNIVATGHTIRRIL